MPLGAPQDPAVRAQWAHARRRAAAEHHPDRGGDTDTYLAALAAVDEAFGIGPRVVQEGRQTTHADVHVRRTWRGYRMRLARRARRAVRTLRSRLPRALPGAAHTTEVRTGPAPRGRV